MWGQSGPEIIVLMTCVLLEMTWLIRRGHNHFTSDDDWVPPSLKQLHYVCARMKIQKPIKIRFAFRLGLRTGTQMTLSCQTAEGRAKAHSSSPLTQNNPPAQSKDSQPSQNTTNPVEKQPTQSGEKTTYPMKCGLACWLVRLFNPSIPSFCSCRAPCFGQGACQLMIDIWNCI